MSEYDPSALNYYACRTWDTDCNTIMTALVATIKELNNTNCGTGEVCRYQVNMRVGMRCDSQYCCLVMTRLVA